MVSFYKKSFFLKFVRLLQALQEQWGMQGLLRRKDQVQQQEPQQELRELCHAIENMDTAIFSFFDLTFLITIAIAVEI